MLAQILFFKKFKFSDPDNKGAMTDDYWGPGQKMMGDIKFLDTLRAYGNLNFSLPIFMNFSRFFFYRQG